MLKRRLYTLRGGIMGWSGNNNKDNEEGDLPSDEHQQKAFIRDTALEFCDPAVRPFVQQLHASEAAYEKIYRDYCDGVYELQRKLQDESNTIFKERSDACKKIPDFWALALSTHEDTKRAISDADVEILHFLEDIQIELLPPPKKGFSVTFVFQEDNPFFDHRTLRKTYELQSDVPTLEPELVKVDVEPAEIKWKSGDPTTVDDKAGQNAVQRPSFFHWFTSITPPLPSNFDISLSEEEREYQELLREAIAADLAIAYAVKDDILPHAVEYYTGEAVREPSPETLQKQKDIVEQARKEARRQMLESIGKSNDLGLLNQIQDNIRDLQIDENGNVVDGRTTNHFQ